MKITFVGSSHGVPEPNRKCSCIMLETENQVYFIDMGTSAIDALRTRGISIDSVKGIFITHSHGDHMDGLISFIDLISWYFTTADPVVCLPDIEIKNAINSWLKVILIDSPRPIRYQEITPGTVYDDGILKVTAIATQHCKNSHAYLVESANTAILFTGDLKHPTIDFPAIVKEKSLDLVVCESAHFSAMEYLPIFSACNIKKVCITHYSDVFLATVLQLKQELTNRNIPTVIAADNLEIVV